jgi:hypothetical protein
VIIKPKNAPKRIKAAPIGDNETLHIEMNFSVKTKRGIK